MDNLRSFHSGIGLDFVTGDDRTRHRSHHAHLYTEILQFFLDQAAGHFQCVVVDAFRVGGRFIQQMHLRKLAFVGVLEQNMLTLFDHPCAGRCSSGFHRRLYHQRGGIFFLMLLKFLLYHSFALACGLLPNGQVVCQFTAFTCCHQPAIHLCPQ